MRQISPIPENISADVNGTGNSEDQEFRVLVDELKQAVAADSDSDNDSNSSYVTSTDTDVEVLPHADAVVPPAASGDMAAVLAAIGAMKDSLTGEIKGQAKANQDDRPEAT